MDMSYDDDSIDSPAAVMKSAIIKDFLEEPDQKFILVYDFMRMWIFLIELIGFDRNDPSSPELLLSVGNPPKEESREEIDEEIFIGDEIDEEEDELGLNDFDDDYSDDDLNDYNEYDY
jgi:hypothetical protein